VLGVKQWNDNRSAETALYLPVKTFLERQGYEVGPCGHANYSSPSRRKPGSIAPLSPVRNAIALLYRPMKGSCNKAMGPGLRRGSE
jgi:hypothetical protein